MGSRNRLAVIRQIRDKKRSDLKPNYGAEKGSEEDSPSGEKLNSSDVMTSPVGRVLVVPGTRGITAGKSTDGLLPGADLSHRGHHWVIQT